MSVSEHVETQRAIERDNHSPDFGRRNGGPTGSPSLASSVRRHPFLVLLPTLLLLAAGIYVGNKKHPTYSATATINVGKSDINTQATPGYVTAAENLASTYSRVVESQHVVNPARACAEQARRRGELEPDGNADPRRAELHDHGEGSVIGVRRGARPRGGRLASAVRESVGDPAGRPVAAAREVSERAEHGEPARAEGEHAQGAPELEHPGRDEGEGRRLRSSRHRSRRSRRRP